MPNSNLFVQTAFLATKSPHGEKELICGKAEAKEEVGNFVFYILEAARDQKLAKKLAEAITQEAGKGPEITDVDFEGILQRANSVISKSIQLKEKGSALNALIGLVVGNQLFLSQTGSTIGYIFRKDKISSIIERGPADSHPLKSFADITSGKIAANDQLVFGSSCLLDRLSLDRLRSIIRQGDPKSQAGELSKYLKRNRSFDINALFLKAMEGEEIDSNGVSDFEEFYYIDEPSETLASTYNKKVKPTVDLAGRVASAAFRKVWGATSKSASAMVSTYLPKVQKAIGGNRHLGRSFGVKEQLKPSFSTSSKSSLKIRTNAYYSKQGDGIAAKTLPYFYVVIDLLRKLFHKEYRKYLYATLLILAIAIGYMKVKNNSDIKSRKAAEIQQLNSYDKAKNSFEASKGEIALGRSTDLGPVYEELLLAEQSASIPENKEKAGALISEIKAFIDKQTNTLRFVEAKSIHLADNILFMTVSGSDLYGLAGDGKIYQGNIQNADSKLIGSIDQDAGQPVGFAYSTALKKILINTAEKKVFAFDTSTKTVEELKIADSQIGWEESTAIDTYSTNIYLLSPVTGVVWKHTEQDSGFSSGSSYLTKKVDIQGAVDLTIDGNVYVLKNDGQLLKFTKGVQDSSFALKGIPKPYSEILIPSRVYTGDDTNNIFVLDKKYSRIIKFDKNGQYISQYIFDKIPLESFSVNTKLQKIWGLAAGTIYEGNL